MQINEICFSSEEEYKTKTKPSYIKKIYLDYKEGRMSRDAYFYEIVAGINPFIKKTITSNNGTLNNSFEELLNNAYIRINEVLDQYDPLGEKYHTPGTFFGSYIKEAKRTTAEGGNKANGYNAYYARQEKKLNDELEKRGYPTLIEKNYAPEELVEITGWSMTSVRGVLKNRNKEAVSYDVLQTVSEVAQDIYENPGDALIERDEEAEIKKYFELCTPLEMYALSVYNGIEDYEYYFSGDQKTMLAEQFKIPKKLARRLTHDKNLYNRFKDELPETELINKDFMGRVLSRAKRKVYCKKNNIPYKEPYYVSEIEFIEVPSEIDLTELNEIAERLGGTVNEDGFIMLEWNKGKKPSNDDNDR